MYRSRGPTGSSSSTLPTIRSGYLTPGDIDPLPNTSGAWQAAAGFTWSVPASAGQQITTAVKFMFRPVTANLDIAVLVGGSPVRYSSSGTATPAIEGDPSLYLTPGTYRTSGTTWSFTAASGDISGGTITFAVMFKGPGDSILYGSTSFPFSWTARAEATS